MQEYKVKKVNKAKEIHLSVPGSKSITNRALLIAALASGKSTLHHVLFSDDSRNFIQSLIDLGFEVEVSEAEEKVSVVGLGGDLPESTCDLRRIYVGSAGTAARFLTAYLGLTKGPVRIDSSEQMKKRPMKELLEAMFELGASIEYLEEVYHFPFIIGNEGLIPSEVTIDVDKSSQFLSALLIASVLMKEDFTIHVTGSHGLAYVEMTISMMKQFGVEVEKKDQQTYFIPKESCYKARDYEIEPDVSAACYFYGMGALLNVPASVKGVMWNSLQGDVTFLKVLEKMGCEIISNDMNELKLLPSKQGLHGGTFDLSAFSDQTLTLAALAPFCKETVEITGVSHIKLQECDRIHAIVSNLSKLGIRVEETETGIRISPGQPGPGKIETFEDHRVAMSFTLIGLVCDGIVILNPLCCKKTFEGYFDIVDSLFEE